MSTSIQPAQMILSCIRRICIFAGVYLFMTSFNTSHYYKGKSDQNLLQTITQWYELHIALEKIDTAAYPPVAARRAAELGLMGMMVWHTQKELYERDQAYFISILNDAYAKTLLQFYVASPAAKNQINNLHKKIALRLPDSSQTAIKFDKPFDFSSAFYPTWPTQSLHFQQAQSEISSNSFEEISDLILPEWQYESVYIKENSTIPISSNVELIKGDESALMQQAMAVYYIGQNLSYEKRWIAEFWSDDVRGLTFSPAGRWISIANQTIERHPISADRMFNFYFSLGIALNDAITLCWKYKYLYQIPRPSQMIQSHFDPQWKPLHDNPMFPSFPSGHAALGSAACTILTEYFGDNIEFSDHSHHQRIEFLSYPRTFKNFHAMAEENALSRIYMGVHYPIDCEEGLNLGKQVGLNTKNTSFTAFLKDHPQLASPDYCISEMSTRYK